LLWVHDIPLWLFGAGTVLVFATLSLVGLYITHRSVRRLSKGVIIIDNAIVGWFFSGIMALYSVTIGLVAVATWQGMGQVSEIASHEAASISALYRDVGAYPEAIRGTAREQIRDYTNLIITKAWPAQRRGQIDDADATKLNMLQQTIFSFEPAGLGQQVVQTEIFRQFNNVVELRRQRIQAVGQGIPTVLWVVVLAGGAICIAFSFGFQIEEFNLHAAMTLGLAVTIALLIFLIGALDQPYRGEVSVAPTAYQLFLDAVSQARRDAPK
jgi:hypothetical protein